MKRCVALAELEDPKNVDSLRFAHAALRALSLAMSLLSQSESLLLGVRNMTDASTAQPPGAMPASPHPAIGADATSTVLAKRLIDLSNRLDQHEKDIKLLVTRLQHRADQHDTQVSLLAGKINTLGVRLRDCSVYASKASPLESSPVLTVLTGGLASGVQHASRRRQGQAVCPGADTERSTAARGAPSPLSRDADLGPEPRARRQAIPGSPTCRNSSP